MRGGGSKKFNFLRNIINEWPQTDWDDKLFSYSLVANDAGPRVILKNEVRPPAACGRLLEFISVSIAFNHWIFMILLSLEFFAWLLLNFNDIIATCRGLNSRKQLIALFTHIHNTLITHYIFLQLYSFFFFIST